MKKKRVVLNQKLFLNKQKIAALTEKESNQVLGGNNPQVGSAICPRPTMNDCVKGRITMIAAVCAGETAFRRIPVVTGFSAGACIQGGAKIVGHF